jgi:hypothetical protein
VIAFFVFIREYCTAVCSFEKGESMKRALPLLFLVMSLPMFAQTTYQLGTNYGGSTFVCSMASRFPITSPYQFNCNVVPLLNNGTQVGSVQIENAGGWIQVHAPGIAEPQQYLESKLSPDMSQFSLPNSAGPGKVVFNYEITDANNNVFHGTVSAPWDNRLICGGRGCQYYAPQLLTTPVDGSLTVIAGAN